MAGTEWNRSCSHYKTSRALTGEKTFWGEKGLELKEKKKKGEGNSRKCSCSSVSSSFSWIPRQKSSVPPQNNHTYPRSKLSHSPACFALSTGPESEFVLPVVLYSPPPRLSKLACEWFLAETAAWTDSRWAKEEAGLSFIQTLLWIAAGGWCIQIPQTLTGLFSWWRPWGEGDGRIRCWFIANPKHNTLLNKCVLTKARTDLSFTDFPTTSLCLLINMMQLGSDLVLSPAGYLNTSTHCTFQESIHQLTHSNK